MRMRDGRNPYGSRGGYVVSGRRSRRRDRGMHEEYSYDQSMMEDGRRRRNARGQYMSDKAYEHEPSMRRDYDDMARESSDYGSFHEERGFKPVEAMGYFTGYYGGGEDYARGGRDYGDYNYDMRYDGNYPMPRMDYRGRDYRYDYGGDYGESLTREELEHWKKKLMQEVDEKDKQFFTKEMIGQKAHQIGAEMKDYNEEELVVATAMVYTDYCKTVKKYAGNNMDIYIELAKDWLEDKDAAIKGGEKLAVYYDCVVEGE